MRLSWIAAIVSLLGIVVATSASGRQALFTKAQITSMNYCEQKYLGVHGDGPEVEARFEAVQPNVRGSILDCETQYEKRHRPPTGAEIAAETRKQELAEEAGSAGVTISRKPDSRTIQTAVVAAHRALLGVTRDPSSTQFNSSDGAAYSLNGDGSLYAVCGGMNTKNGFGGYTGEKIWIYVIPTNAVYTPENGVTDAMALRDCAGGIHKARKHNAK